MIVVNGPTGALNGATGDHLLERVPADEVVVAVRDTAKAQRFANRGVAVRRGDYADPDSLPGAFEGADQHEPRTVRDLLAQPITQETHRPQSRG